VIWIFKSVVNFFISLGLCVTALHSSLSICLHPPSSFPPFFFIIGGKGSDCAAAVFSYKLCNTYACLAGKWCCNGLHFHSVTPSLTTPPSPIPATSWTCCKCITADWMSTCDIDIIQLLKYCLPSFLIAYFLSSFLSLTLSFSLLLSLSLSLSLSPAWLSLCSAILTHSFSLPTLIMRPYLWHFSSAHHLP